MTLLAFRVDVRSRHSRDYAFCLYLFGVLTFWGGFKCPLAPLAGRGLG
jgi:hypothetical protein